MQRGVERCDLACQDMRTAFGAFWLRGQLGLRDAIGLSASKAGEDDRVWHQQGSFK